MRSGLHMGREAIDLMQSEDYVELTIRDMDTREVRRVRSRYLIGIDGANSLVRAKIGSGRKDLGFEADWLVIDMLLKDDVTVKQLGFRSAANIATRSVRPRSFLAASTTAASAGAGSSCAFPRKRRRRWRPPRKCGRC